jgi:hypothetical protein
MTAFGYTRPTKGEQWRKTWRPSMVRFHWRWKQWGLWEDLGRTIITITRTEARHSR